MNNTLLRAEFRFKFGLLTVNAEITKGIKFIVDCQHGYYRTAEQQKKLFDEGKSNCDGKTKISYHQLDRAHDIYVIDDKGLIVWDEKSYQLLAEFWKSIGGRWGGDFPKKDIFHFEY